MSSAEGAILRDGCDSLAAGDVAEEHFHRSPTSTRDSLVDQELLEASDTETQAKKEYENGENQEVEGVVTAAETHECPGAIRHRRDAGTRR